MKYKFCIIVFLFFLNACIKDFFIKDKDFSMKVLPYTGNELKIDGYFYKKIDDEKSIFLVLYTNGVQFGGNGMITPTIEIEGKLRDTGYISYLRDCRPCWSPFEVNNNVLRFEFYDIFKGTNWHTCFAHCKILNDTTFTVEKITFSKTGKKVNVEREGSSSCMLGEFHFKQFSPKPDSTNNFIP